ncbi:hypothetical protein ACIA5D_50545 [Actinoplanes sp. NPDC051513]|uniref:hypothetical protein n=1 Tax=Actinoplanes sp. NPDC051513 TaxID=3363908 RepID=UPI0037AE679E
MTRHGASIRVECDGFAIVGAEVRGVVNRLGGGPRWTVGIPVSDRDRRYANAELRAFFLSWLTALPCPVVNPPTAASLDPVQWTLLAAAAGLPAAPVRLRTGTLMTETSSRFHLLVIGDAVIGASSDAIAQACRRLSRLGATPILGVALGDDGRFSAANPTPDLVEAGPQAIDALADLLTNCVTPR